MGLEFEFQRDHKQRPLFLSKQVDSSLIDFRSEWKKLWQDHGNFCIWR